MLYNVLITRKGQASTSPTPPFEYTVIAKAVSAGEGHRHSWWTTYTLEQMQARFQPLLDLHRVQEWFKAQENLEIKGQTSFFVHADANAFVDFAHMDVHG